MTREWHVSYFFIKTLYWHKKGVAQEGRKQMLMCIKKADVMLILLFWWFPLFAFHAMIHKVYTLPPVLSELLDTISNCSFFSTAYPFSFSFYTELFSEWWVVHRKISFNFVHGAVFLRLGIQHKSSTIYNMQYTIYNIQLKKLIYTYRYIDGQANYISNFLSICLSVCLASFCQTWHAFWCPFDIKYRGLAIWPLTFLFK